jgi:hypothetical protein
VDNVNGSSWVASASLMIDDDDDDDVVKREKRRRRREREGVQNRCVPRTTFKQTEGWDDMIKKEPSQRASAKIKMKNS